MTRTLADARRWTADGTAMFLTAVDWLAETDLDAPTLPGWTRRHLIAHVAANADAIGNLVRWAATGTPTPMYASARERADGIARGASMTGAELIAWLHASSTVLTAAMRGLDDEQWTHPVVTAQGRTVPASETAWMRAREVFVHAVDLGTGVTFDALPADFLTALVEDVTARRGSVPHVEGPLAERAAWLTGRPHRLTDAPDLGPWL